MNAYMYTYIHTYIRTHVMYIYTLIDLGCTCAFLYIHIYVDMYIYAYTHMSLCSVTGFQCLEFQARVVQRNANSMRLQCRDFEPTECEILQVLRHCAQRRPEPLPVGVDCKRGAALRAPAA